MTDVPGTYPEHSIMWSLGRPATASRRRPVDVPIQNFCIFVFPIKNRNRCVKQGLLQLKSTFFIKSPFFSWFPKSPLKVPWRSRMLGPLGDLQVMSLGRRVPAGGSVLAPVKRGTGSKRVNFSVKNQKMFGFC